MSDEQERRRRILLGRFRRTLLAASREPTHFRFDEATVRRYRALERNYRRAQKKVETKRDGSARSINVSCYTKPRRRTGLSTFRAASARSATAASPSISRLVHQREKPTLLRLVIGRPNEDATSSPATIRFRRDSLYWRRRLRREQKLRKCARQRQQSVDIEPSKTDDKNNSSTTSTTLTTESSSCPSRTSPSDEMDISRVGFSRGIRAVSCALTKVDHDISRSLRRIKDRNGFRYKLLKHLKRAIRMLRVPMCAGLTIYGLYSYVRHAFPLLSDYIILISSVLYQYSGELGLSIE